MKFKIPAGGPRQYQSIAVSVSAKVLAEILEQCSPNQYQSIPSWQWIARIKQTMKDDSGQFFLFAAGAKLGWSRSSKTFYIHGYYADGRDQLQAIEQLKMGAAKRQAEIHRRRGIAIIDGRSIR